MVRVSRKNRTRIGISYYCQTKKRKRNGGDHVGYSTGDWGQTAEVDTTGKGAARFKTLG